METLIVWKEKAVKFFESLLVKEDGKWLAIMEYQIKAVTKEEWDKIQP